MGKPSKFVQSDHFAQDDSDDISHWETRKATNLISEGLDGRLSMIATKPPRSVPEHCHSLRRARTDFLKYRS